MHIVVLISTAKFKQVVKILYALYVVYDFVIVYKHLFLFLIQYGYRLSTVCRSGLCRR